MHVGPPVELIPAQFGIEPVQPVDVVDIVPDRQAMNLKTDFTGAFERLRSNALRAPGDVFEHLAVRGFQPEQIIAAVVTSTLFAAIAGPRQRRGALVQERRRQSRTVGIEHYGGAM